MPEDRSIEKFQAEYLMARFTEDTLRVRNPVVGAGFGPRPRLPGFTLYTPFPIESLLDLIARRLGIPTSGDTTTPPPDGPFDPPSDGPSSSYSSSDSGSSSSGSGSSSMGSGSGSGSGSGGSDSGSSGSGGEGSGGSDSSSSGGGSGGGEDCFAALSAFLEMELPDCENQGVFDCGEEIPPPPPADCYYRMEILCPEDCDFCGDDICGCVAVPVWRGSHFVVYLYCVGVDGTFTTP